jgi:hypothetical protein
MKTYAVTYEVREFGAIGIFYPSHPVHVSAPDEHAARELARSEFARQSLETRFPINVVEV